MKEEEIDAECESYGEYEMRYIEYIAKINECLNKTDASAAVSRDSQPDLKSNVQIRLPKIEPTYL